MQILLAKASNRLGWKQIVENTYTYTYTYTYTLTLTLQVLSRFHEPRASTFTFVKIIRSTHNI